MPLSSHLKSTRVILLDPQWGNNTYPYYFGMIKELERSGIDVVHIKEKIYSIAQLKNHGVGKNDVLVFGYGWLGNEIFHRIEGLEDLQNKKICFFHKPFNNFDDKISFVKESQFSVLLSSTPMVEDLQKLTNTKSLLFPYACDHRIFGIKSNKNRKYDIGFSGALHLQEHYKNVEFSSANLRSRAQHKIAKYFGGKKFINGSDRIRFRIRSTRAYAKKLENARMWLSTTGPLHDMSSRYFEVSGSGAICLTNKIPVGYSHIFKDGENVIEFSEDCSNLLDVLADTLDRPNVLAEMSHHTKNEIMQNHTYERRANEFLEIIDKLG